MIRLPIIRHIRWAYLSWRLNRWMRLWAALGYFTNPNDIEYLNAVWRGDA